MNKEFNCQQPDAVSGSFKVYIKNMVCPLYIAFVKQESDKLGIKYNKVEQDKIEIAEPVSEVQLKQLELALQPYGLELLVDDPRKNLVKKIKAAVNNLLNRSTDELKMILPIYINNKMSYGSLNEFFEIETGTDIEGYYNKKKMIKAKELLTYYKLSPTEITYQLGYTNVADLTNQFKRVTNSIPEEFMQTT